MANYSRIDTPGPKKSFLSESVPVVGSSTQIPHFTCPVDAAYMQETIDGYVLCDTNTDTSKVYFTDAVNTYTLNQLVGNYAYVTFPVPEVRLILSNTATDVSDQVILTVDRPFSSAPTDGHSVSVRLWEDFNLPKLFSSLNQFTENYLSKTAAGSIDWNDSKSVYYTINEFIEKGGVYFYITPVISDSDASVMEERLGVGVTQDADWKARMLNSSPAPTIFCVPKQDCLEATLSASNWAVVDAAWVSYIETRATNNTEDPLLREHIYIAGTPSSSTAAAVIYRTTTWAATAERALLYHGKYTVPSLTRGTTQVVDPAPAICGIINRISTTAPNSWGHALWGENFSKLNVVSMVEVNQSPSDRSTLRTNGINPIFTTKGRGTWVESQYTQNANSGSTGSEPLDFGSVVLGRAMIWNQAQPILASVIAEPNTNIARTGLKNRIDTMMSNLVRQNFIFRYDLSENSSPTDITSGIVRLELKVYFFKEIDHVELKLTATLGG